MKTETGRTMDREEAIEVRRLAHEAAAGLVVHDLLPDADVSVETSRTGFRGEFNLIVRVSLPSFPLRVLVRDYCGGDLVGAEFPTQLRLRIGEATLAADKFVARLADVRTKVEASAQRNGGMTLRSLEMQAYDIRQPFDWFDLRIEAGIEYIGVLLRPEIEVISDFTARAIAGTIRFIGAKHRRRVKVLARFAELGAVAEIDHEAERAIRESGRTIAEVYCVLADRQAVELRPGSAGSTISMFDGRIFLMSMHDQRTKRRPVMPEELLSKTPA